MTKRHKGSGAGDPGQDTGRRRGPETGNGYTASTGHGMPTGVVFRGGGPERAGRNSVLRTIGDVITGHHRRK